MVAGVEAADWGEAFIVVGGAALAILGGGWVIALLLAPFAAKLRPADDAAEGLARAGLYIGWLERALLYTFMMAGAASAAVAVVALKSVARLESLKDARFIEYYLIGTLASVLAATLVALAVRAILGWDTLLK